MKIIFDYIKVKTKNNLLTINNVGKDRSINLDGKYLN